ncbi:MAG: excinuclease ABC subunit A, partial [Pirellulales bacterium]
KDGWFFHAITGETWLLKMKFRTAKKTFHRDSLVADLALKRLNELEELPVYGNRQRVRAKNIRGPWQEVQIDVHSADEIDGSEFRSFLERAVAGFLRVTERVEQDPTAIMPWKVLGRKWHVSRKGFPPGKRIHWETEVLEELCDLLSTTAPDGEFSWHNQAVVHLTIGPGNRAWASLHTKRPDGLDLVLTGPKGRFALGRVARLGAARELRGEANGSEQVKLRFQRRDEVASPELATFLEEHLSAVREIDSP